MTGLVSVPAHGILWYVFTFIYFHFTNWDLAENLGMVIASHTIPRIASISFQVLGSLDCTVSAAASHRDASGWSVRAASYHDSL
jgi:hypothetical protein